MKYKKIPKEYFVTILDRLTRLEPAHIRYKRVFDDIINKFSITDKVKSLALNEETAIVEEIFNSSLNKLFDDYLINDVLSHLEEKYFNFNNESYQYLSARLNISQMIDETDDSLNLPKNVKWLKKINHLKENPEYLRKKYSLLYPIEKIILCEGETENRLLKTIFGLFNIDFDKLGYMVLPAGGKNQVAKKYYQMIEYIKTPFFILLDNDANRTKQLIYPKLRDKDTLYLIESGEFEDLIPKQILQKTINFVHKNDYNCIVDDFDNNVPMAKNLENIYKKYGFGEFKKAEFAAQLNDYIIKNCTKDDFLNSEIIEIAKSLQGS